MIKGENLVFLGIGVIIVGMLLIFVGSFFLASGKPEDKDLNSEKVSTGGVVMIGPIPIIFGTDKSMLPITIILAIILMVVYYLLFYRGVT